MDEEGARVESVWENRENKGKKEVHIWDIFTLIDSG